MIRLEDFSLWLHQAGRGGSILLFSQILLLLPLPPRGVPLLSYVGGSVPARSVSKLIYVFCGFGARLENVWPLNQGLRFEDYDASWDIFSHPF